MGFGVFLSVDPELDPSNPQQTNGYSYANNNPVTQSDPSGLRPIGDNGSDTSIGCWGTTVPCSTQRKNVPIISYIQQTLASADFSGGGYGSGSDNGSAGGDVIKGGRGTGLPSGKWTNIPNGPPTASGEPQQGSYIIPNGPTDNGITDMFTAFTTLVGVGEADAVISGLEGTLAVTATESVDGVADALPDLPAYAGGKTSGVLVRSDGTSTDITSGLDGPSSTLSKPRPGMNGNIVGHVEAHAAAIMRDEGLTDATLWINRAPCGGANGCMINLSRMVPQGSTLAVYVMPGGSDGAFEGMIIVTGTG